MSDHAYPSEFGHGFEKQIERGLTKREWFAGIAMLGHFILNQHNSDFLTADNIAKGSKAMADAMVAALEQKP